MKIKMTGVSGYLGTRISSELKKNKHHVSPVAREMLYGPAETLASEIKNTDMLINLAGAPILRRWTSKAKKQIYDSRIKTAENLARAFQILYPGERPTKVISVSAIGIYSPGHLHSEESKDFDKSFLGGVIKDWEKAWDGLPDDVSLTIFRIGVVLGKESEAIKNMMLPFKLGVGGKVGNGRQPFPFIHETDVVQAFMWAVKNRKTKGIFNLVAPQAINNAEFTRELAKKLKRPAFLRVPPFALELIYGKAASMLTKSPAVLSEKITNAGFEFQYPTIEQTLNEIIE